jgi:hypothetical protein
LDKKAFINKIKKKMDEENKIEINIKFTNQKNIIIKIKTNEPISNLKKEVIANYKDNDINFERKTLRLIFKGKLLEDSFPIKYYKIENEDYIHCVVSESQTTNTRQTQARRIDLENGNSQEEIQLNRGFDRLRDAGFGSEEILLFRSQFYKGKEELLEKITKNEINDEDLFLMEEKW